MGSPDEETSARLRNSEILKKFTPALKASMMASLSVTTSRASAGVPSFPLGPARKKRSAADGSGFSFRLRRRREVAGFSATVVAGDFGLPLFPSAGGCAALL